MQRRSGYAHTPVMHDNEDTKSHDDGTCGRGVTDRYSVGAR
jgi:hypothetical protein